MTFQDVVILFPGHSLDDFPTDLPDEKAAGLLNAFSVAWHPALLAAAKGLPREQRADEPPNSSAGQLVLIPPACDDLVPAEWIGEARGKGAIVITGQSTRDDLVRALFSSQDPESSSEQPTVDADLVSDFFALGTCKLLLELLTRRMHHFGDTDDGRLEREAVAAAEAAIASNADDARAHLQTCFEILTEARERFYPVECYLLDLCLVIPRLADAHFRAALASTKPLNLLATAADIEMLTREHSDLEASLRQSADAGTLDVLGGEWHERPVPLLPITSVLREFELGHDAFRRCLGRTPTTWARRRYGLATLIPQILQRFGIVGGLHVALDDGIYPDQEQSRTRWEGCDGSVVDSSTRIPLAAESAASYLRFPSRMAESMQQDQTAAIVLARWPEVRVPFWDDLERIHKYSPVLGRFVTFRQFFEQADDFGRLSRFEEREYLSPFLIQAVAAEEPDPISRFQRHYRRRAQFDAGAFLDGLASILHAKPVGTESARELEDRLESSGPDLPPKDPDATTRGTPAFDDANMQAFVDRAAERVAVIILQGAGNEAGYLVLNPLAFNRTVTISAPRVEVPPAVQSPIRGVQFDKGRRQLTIDVPACGYVWIPSRDAKPPRTLAKSPPLAEGSMIHNEFIEVHVNEATGGIAKIKQFGRKPNRLSQQLAFRFPRERNVAGTEGHPAGQERTYYSQMRCSSLTITSSGPGLGEILTTGTLNDPEDGSTVAEYEQTVRLWRGRPVIELEIELKPQPARMPDGDPWSNYFASRFAWNDSAATLTRSVLGGAHGFQLERFESPHFIEIATESQRTTILTNGLPFHRKIGMRMVDSLLIVAGETARRFRFGIAIDADFPMQPSLDFLSPAVVIETSNGPPSASRSGWLFHLNAKNVQVLQILPLKEPDPTNFTTEDEAGHLATGRNGFILRLMETEGRHRPVEIRSFRTPTRARQCDFRGETIATLKIVDDAVLLEMTAYEIVDVELRFDDPL